MLPNYADVRFCIDTIMHVRVKKMMRRVVVWGGGFLALGGLLFWAISAQASQYLVFLTGGALSLITLIFILDVGSFSFKMFAQLRFERVYKELSLLGQHFLLSPDIHSVSHVSLHVLIENLEKHRLNPQQPNHVRETFWKSLCEVYCLQRGVPASFFSNNAKKCEVTGDN